MVFCIIRIYNNICKSRAVVECIIADACHTLADSHTLKALATTECIFADACYAVGNGDARKARAGNECTISDAYYTLTYSYTLKARAVSECSIADACYAVGDVDARKARVRECPIADACYAVWDADARKARAVIECSIADACYAAGNGDTGYVGAVFERLYANLLDGQAVVGARNNDIGVGASADACYGVEGAVGAEGEVESARVAHGIIAATGTDTVIAVFMSESVDLLRFGKYLAAIGAIRALCPTLFGTGGVFSLCSDGCMNMTLQGVFVGHKSMSEQIYRIVYVCVAVTVNVTRLLYRVCGGHQNMTQQVYCVRDIDLAVGIHISDSIGL